MLFRKLELNWRYGISELLIVVAGVLIALAVDNWNDTRLALQAERDYLQRLEEDLQADTVTYSFTVRVAEQKNAALAEVSRVLRGDASAPIDTAAFLADVVTSSLLGWNTPGSSTTTYDDLISTGNLSLIRDTQLRSEITAYYSVVAGTLNRVEGRRGAYPSETYRLVRRRAGSRNNQLGVSEFFPLLDEGSEPAALVLNRIRSSDLGELIVAEQNLTNFIGLSYVALREEAVALLAELRD